MRVLATVMRTWPDVHVVSGRYVTSTVRLRITCREAAALAGHVKR